VGPEVAALVGPKAAAALGGWAVVAQEAEAWVWRSRRWRPGRWRSRGAGVEESGGGAAGPWPAVGIVVEESALTNGGKHVDLDDRVREEGSEWGWGRARGFG
jgi:hypothetical protein